jgi:hypothetical protein
MRTSYTVTLPEEPPAAPFPTLAKELRPRSPLSPSLLLSTFVGLLLNKAKVRKPFTWTHTHKPAEGFGIPPPPRDSPTSPHAPRWGDWFLHPSPQGLRARNAPSPGDHSWLTPSPPLLLSP